jgi:hypothetical protein
MPTQINLPGRRYKYEVDSMLLGSHNSSTCTQSHQICGITCDGKRYIYNGWLRDMYPDKKRNVSRPMPCELMEIDWMSPGSSNFVIDRQKCRLTEVKSSWIQRLFSLGISDTPVFHINKGSRTYIYVSSRHA